MKKILAGMLVLLGFNLMAQKPTIVTGDEKGWYQIGKASASFKKERESIVVMGKDEFAIIKLRVNNAPINIERMQIFYEGGKIQEVDLKQPLKPGEETREINLDADNKEIDKVVFTYHSVNSGSGEKAEIELYGFKEHRDGDDKAGLRKDAEEVGDEIEDETKETRDDLREEAREAEDDVDEAAHETHHDLKDAADDAEDDLDDSADDADRNLREGADEAEDDVDEAVEQTEEDLEDAAKRAEDAADDTGDEIEEEADDLRDETRDEFREGEDNLEEAADDAAEDVENGAAKTEDELEEGADNIKDETKEHTRKLKSEITDRELEDKAGPNGQEIYIDDNSNYYYIDEQGNRIYVAPEELKERVRD